MRRMRKGRARRWRVLLPRRSKHRGRKGRVVEPSLGALRTYSTLGLCDLKEKLLRWWVVLVAYIPRLFLRGASFILTLPQSLRHPQEDSCLTDYRKTRQWICDESNMFRVEGDKTMANQPFSLVEKLVDPHLGV